MSDEQSYTGGPNRPDEVDGTAGQNILNVMGIPISVRIIQNSAYVDSVSANMAFSAEVEIGDDRIHHDTDTYADVVVEVRNETTGATDEYSSSATRPYTTVAIPARASSSVGHKIRVVAFCRRGAHRSRVHAGFRTDVV